MMSVCSLLLAVLSIWDYPVRQAEHLRCRDAFLVAMRSGDTKGMETACLKGTELLPDDPTWAYNLACALAYRQDPAPALDQLEKAIDLGFRDAEAIRNDSDLQRLAGERRFDELVEYAKLMAERPILMGPMVSVPATGVTGKTLVLGEQNVGWNFDDGCFTAFVSLAEEGSGGNRGDLYINRDGDHSRIAVTNFPGLTEIRLDREGRQRGMDVDFPNMEFSSPLPVFGNCSRAYVEPTYWRSLPRALMTTEAARLQLMMKLYLSNQVWVYPANADFPPDGAHGDCFSSVTPYWLVTQGHSWSDRYYVEAALEVSRSLHPVVKKRIVADKLLAPTVQMLIRKSLSGVASEEDYLTEKAHPTCLPPDGLNLDRLKSLSAALTAESIPPLAVVQVITKAVQVPNGVAECLYATPFASAFVLRAPDPERTFVLRASGGDEYAFRQVHGSPEAVRLVPDGPDRVGVTLVTDLLTNRVDIAVFAKTGGSGWGAPSYVSFHVLDPEGDYCDPALVPRIPVE